MKKETKQENNFDSLANMIAAGFDGVDKQFEVVTSDVGNLKSDVSELRSDVGELKSDVSELKSKVSKIDYRVDEIYDILARFEEGDILDLQKRIKILERAVKVLGKQLI
ncbi:MAG: hypothetical protein A2736_02280 [Candidatus Yanofskybacteria bacterium RIFCSPHIGHO2_01_FULL_41_27]|uniref:Uncharacterized protein n=3 Tax=Parcubacteria group TaxID=1794811 RepID=A0A1F8HV34_9BACT|nr:MAG: hypothetical protein UU83_C0043G0010 [Candidatus Jorgensenbacteria bacterium GW2011_GWF2_41_8]OGN00530.1 MAG: hypothetical protein A2736_02280 [Candidatus Yanofskybacteria bacterium RIFCSPHIGHO2_01_FULL_41_27]OGN08809.1 MAG: hypothetical protein A3C64_02130 [Candidatus Yanofskybacteria bacterium RIFCSPHIGHO2_02_FULL_41_12]OGN21846.1 MAG: hypothetical protein A3B00_01390 [Candidatus Yanofskybacteria bacterium RIFCSPLOWO2_01_FULL_41_33]OGN41437.1 MAG: hypothetical protein A2606_03960 [Can